MSERKRLIKLARRVLPEQVAITLEADDEIPAGHFFVGTDPGHCVVCCWHVVNGLMELTIDDDALALACTQHLRATGARVFRSEAEVEAYADAQGWPGRRSGS